MKYTLAIPKAYQSLASNPMSVAYLAVFSLSSMLLAATPVTAQKCEANSFIDKDSAVRTFEQFEVIGSCSRFLAPSVVCPDGYEAVGETTEWCGNSWSRWDWKRVVVCQACSIKRYIVTKEVLTSCENDSSTWCGFLPNDIKDPLISEILGGVWYMDGNPYPEEAVTFHGATWTEDIKVEVKTYKEKNWAIHSTSAGAAQSSTFLGAAISLVLDFDFVAAKKVDAEFGKGHISPEVGWFRDATDTFIRGMLGHEMNLKTTSDQNTLLRINAAGDPVYTLRRFISPDGTPVEGNFDIWKADVYHEPRPDTGFVRTLNPMPDVWLNEKLSVADCPSCLPTSRCIEPTMSIAGLCDL